MREILKQQESAVGENVDNFGDYCQFYISLSDALRLLSIPQKQLCIICESYISFRQNSHIETDLNHQILYQIGDWNGNYI